MDDLRYPVGKFDFPESVSAQDLTGFVEQIAETPSMLRAALQGLSESQLDTPYREGGWSVRQVVHHVPESHMNAYIRFKLALTEDEPTIKPYAEDRWAELADSKSTPIEVSLTLLDAMHDRWVRLLRSLTPEEWKRTFRGERSTKFPKIGSRRSNQNFKAATSSASFRTTADCIRHHMSASRCGPPTALCVSCTLRLRTITARWSSTRGFQIT